MPLAFSKADVRHACGDRAYARGRDYARHHRVLDIDPQQTDEGLRVRSSVRGNAVYEQEIHVSEFMDVIEIEGECTCPVGYNCKHVAAALTSMLDEARPEPLARQRQQIAHWVTRVAEARTPEQWLPELGEQILLYVLAPSARQTHRVEVRLQISRMLKSGKGYGKPRTLGLYEMQGTRMQQVAQPVDDTILRLLSGLSRYYAIELRGDLGAMALTRMLATGRLHWRDINDPPLHPGEPRQLQVAWRHEGDQLHLSLDTEPGGAILLLSLIHISEPTRRH